MLDPFAGTGTSLIAAKKLGRNYIGIELDDKYVSIAKEKLRHTRSDSHIGGIWISKYLNGIASIRDKDWSVLKDHFYMPHPIPLLEYENIVYKNGRMREIKHFAEHARQETELPLFE